MMYGTGHDLLDGRYADGLRVSLALPSGNGWIAVRAGQTGSLPKRTREDARHIGFGEEPAFSRVSAAL
jgi:hypothetical protein